jgi:glycosyltransferase involved in cell wall biosynthesis
MKRQQSVLIKLTFMNDLPLISIVTPSLNQASFIGEALQSVERQSYANWEHLVMDGMSTDGTVDLLRDMTSKKEQQKLFWVSERDSGQSDALNKGFRRVRGDIIGWLNSDDRYRVGCFEHIVKAFEENPSVDIVYGDYLMVDESGNPFQIRREIEFSKFILLYHRVLYIPTTATFFRRRIFDENNWLEADLQYAMDLEFFIRLSARGYRFKHIPQLLADFRFQANSKTCSAPDRQRVEHQQVIFAAAPILRRLKSPHLRGVVLSLLRSIACLKRYSEKMFRGYYWEQFRSTGSSLNGM